MKCKFNNVKVSGMAAVVPENFIDIDDELEYFNNDIKKLNRNKKILGLGRRYYVLEGVTAVDLCEGVANRLISEMNIDRNEIDSLILVTTSPDYYAPSSSCILHGRLDLNEDCASFDVNMGCSGYVYGLWLAHSLIASGASRKCLLLAGETVSNHSDVRNRLVNILFGDAASATLVEVAREDTPSYFSMNTRGKDWDKIVIPAGGWRLPIKDDIINLEVTDAANNVWHLWEDLLQGLAVFKFTMSTPHKSILDIIEFSGLSIEDIDFFALHQANKQIVETILNQAKIPSEKSSTETFTKYANCGGLSVHTVICDQLADRCVSQILLCAYGIGLSWASCIIDMNGTYNGGITILNNPDHISSREDQINQWVSIFKDNPT